MRACKTGKIIFPGFACCRLEPSYDDNPKRRLFEVLKRQRMQLNQQLEFLSDGGETVRNLQLFLSPEAEHLLDWFHVAMRLTVLHPTAKGLPISIGTEVEQRELREPSLKLLDSIKWYLWHGNTYEALQHLESLEMDLATANEENKNATTHKLLRAVEEFHTYITNNQALIPNYCERYRRGDRISGLRRIRGELRRRQALCQAATNAVSPQGAHLLLQTRIQVLNGELEQTFREWHPGFRLVDTENLKKAA